MNVDVRPLHADELDAAAAVLSDAFVHEAGLNYWLRQDASKERSRRKFFDAVLRDMLHPKREVHVAETDGVTQGAAIWLGPGLKAFDFPWWRELFYTPLFLSIAGVAGLERARELGARLTSCHPAVPHAHLQFLGVSSAAQGHGIGSAILKQTLAPLDASGTVGYLEASTERNVALYARHGFEVTNEFDLPGLHFWCMTRMPR
ncbi:MAG: GNAT family N-acetyltransferase [Hyphomonadaceae bacterium]|nr:GNAT family N-acetyltransferase [Hyphomonadaceae bacterium]